MGKLIKRFSDGSFLEYARGRFDDWCVYYTTASGEAYPPKDNEYFEKLKELSNKHGNKKLYNDFVKVYDWTDKVVDSVVLLRISELSTEYGEDTLDTDIIFSTLYVTMISEENKAGTRLGKRIKRLGVHVLLIEDFSVDYAANFMKNKSWRYISNLCDIRGF